MMPMRCLKHGRAVDGCENASQAVECAAACGERRAKPRGEQPKCNDMNKDSQPPSDPALAPASGYALCLPLGLPPERGQIELRLNQYERRAKYLGPKIGQLEAGTWRDRLEASFNRALHGAKTCRELLAHNDQIQPR